MTPRPVFVRGAAGPVVARPKPVPPPPGQPAACPEDVGHVDFLITDDLDPHSGQPEFALALFGGTGNPFLGFVDGGSAFLLFATDFRPFHQENVSFPGLAGHEEMFWGHNDAWVIKYAYPSLEMIAQYRVDPSPTMLAGLHIEDYNVLVDHTTGDQSEFDFGYVTYAWTDLQEIVCNDRGELFFWDLRRITTNTVTWDSNDGTSFATRTYLFDDRFPAKLVKYSLIGGRYQCVGDVASWSWPDDNLMFVQTWYNPKTDEMWTSTGGLAEGAFDGAVDTGPFGTTTNSTPLPNHSTPSRMVVTNLRTGTSRQIISGDTSTFGFETVYDLLLVMADGSVWFTLDFERLARYDQNGLRVSDPIGEGVNKAAIVHRPITNTDLAIFTRDVDDNEVLRRVDPAFTITDDPCSGGFARDGQLVYIANPKEYVGFSGTETIPQFVVDFSKVVLQDAVVEVPQRGAGAIIDQRVRVAGFSPRIVKNRA